VRNDLAAKTRDDPDFWSVVGLTELRLYEAIAERKLAIELDAIMREYDDLHARVSATTSWGSVRDQVRFVLPKYEARATAPEKKAAIALTRYLENLRSGSKLMPQAGKQCAGRTHRLSISDRRGQVKRDGLRAVALRESAIA
jgi:hypothetical protein